MLKYLPAKARGLTKLDWLTSYHSFSFGDYYDPEWLQFGNLSVLNDDTVLGESGFNWHGHSNMEILTYVTSGELYHEDTLGNSETLIAGDFQLMSAGSGIRHKELNLTKDPVHFFQIWFIPNELDTEPYYERLSQVKSQDITTVFGDGGLKVKQDLGLKLVRCSGSYTTNGGRKEAVHIVSGSMVVNDIALEAGDAMFIEGEYEFTGDASLLHFAV